MHSEIFAHNSHLQCDKREKIKELLRILDF